MSARAGTSASGPHSPDGSCTPWWWRPIRCPGGGAVVGATTGAVVGGTAVAPGLVAVCWAVLNVAAVAPPLPSRVTVTGLVSPKLAQLRLVKDMSIRLARKVSRLLPTAGTGEGAPASSAWLALRNAVWMLTMFWQ